LKYILVVILSVEIYRGWNTNEILGLIIRDMVSESIRSIVGLPASSTLQVYWIGLKRERVC